MVRIWLGHHGLVGEVDGVEEVGDGVGQGHGLVEGHSATFHHGRDPDGYLVEELVGGFSDGLGALDGTIHGMDIRTGQHHTIGSQHITRSLTLESIRGGDRGMYWWYWYPPYTPIYPLPYDPMYLMATAFQWMIYPYYWMFYIEAYRVALDAWRKAFEAITKSLEQAVTK